MHIGSEIDPEPIHILELIPNPYRSWKEYLTHTGSGILTLVGHGTDSEHSKPFQDLNLILNPCRSWHISRPYKDHGSDSQPIPVLELIMNLYLILNSYRLWILWRTFIDLKSSPNPIPVRELMLNPSRYSDWSWTHTYPGICPYPIPILELNRHSYRSWNWYWTQESGIDPESVSCVE